MGRHPKQILNSAENPGKMHKMKVTPSVLRGMKDILPGEQIYWDYIKEKIFLLSRKYDYQRIDTPLLEEKSLFQKGLGKHSDIISKELFGFADQGGGNVCLKPDGTVPVARAYIKHAMNTLPQPIKLFYIDKMFRYERPQSGRYRQFTQIGFEALGDSNPVLDAQLILISKNLFDLLNLNATLQINSIGCDVCRRGYLKEVTSFFKTKKSRLCAECRKNLSKQPLKILTCQEKNCQNVAEGCPQIVDWLCEDCKKHFVKLLEYLDELEVPYDLNPYLIRNLDYYTMTVFEFWPNEADKKEGQQISLCGGGRYDNLVELIGGKPTPAVGMGIGIERIILQLKKHNIKIPQPPPPTVFLAQLGDQARMKCLRLFEELHQNNICAAESFARSGLKSQLELADKLKVKFTLILGQKEVLDKTILLRNMDGGMQEIIDFKKIIPELKKKIEESQG